MKRQRTQDHEPAINESTATCSCRRWNGPMRLLGETRGKYTLRAKASHDGHLADVARFEASQLAIFETQRGLFEAEGR
jgi:hypothetical protein